MKYLKIFVDFLEDTKELTDAEIGRLFRAMLLYADKGEETNLKGNERFFWNPARRNIDCAQEAYERKVDCINENREYLKIKRLKSDRNQSEISLKSEQDKDKDKEKDKDKPPKGGVGGKFRKPSLEEVREYCEERRNGIDPEEFIAYYESKGWVVGRNSPMKNWKMAMTTWEKNRKKNDPAPAINEQEVWG